jgi:fimbrial chaperone protein
MRKIVYKVRSLFEILGNSLVFLIFVSSVAFAGDFKVSPMKLEFDKNRKTDVLTLKNVGDDELRLQVEAMQWSQDANGKDAYSETSDIFFYPQILVIKAKESKVIRAGIKMPPTEEEKTYRLFVTEIPKRGKDAGVKISIAIRFGVPMFVKPLEAKPVGEITDMVFAGGELGVSVKNSGNVHFMIEKISISAKGSSENEVFSEELSGWYLLRGVSRLYKASIPTEACNDVETLDVAVKLKDVPTLSKRINVDRSMCSK